MFVWRHLYIASLLSVLGSFACADDGSAECGKLLDGAIDGDTIYVFCPSLTGLSKHEASVIVEAALDQAPRHEGDFVVIFLSDPAVLARDWQHQDMEKRLASWGDVFVGMYHTSSGLLMYRSSSDGKWRNIQL